MQEILLTHLASGPKRSVGTRGPSGLRVGRGFRWKKLRSRCGARVEGSECELGVQLRFQKCVKDPTIAGK